MQLPAERAKAAADALGCSAGTGPPFCWHWLRSISIDYVYLLVVSLSISKLKSIYCILTKFIGIPVCCDHQKSQPEVKPCWDARPRDQPCFGTSSLQPFMGREVALAALADVWAQMVTDQVGEIPSCEQISLHNETQQANWPMRSVVGERWEPEKYSSGSSAVPKIGCLIWGWSDLRKRSKLSVSCKQKLAQIHTESPDLSQKLYESVKVTHWTLLWPLGWIPSNEKTYSWRFCLSKPMDPRRDIPRSCSATRRSFRLDRCKSMKTNGGLSYIEHWNRLDGS